jgi:cutinase
MKITALAAASLATLAAAAPAEKRQSCTYGFVFARGSTEPSPLGILIGPSLQSSLRGLLPGMQTFPVGYAASIMTNISFDRTDAASIQKGVEAFNQAAAKCKTIVAGGYSQGAAVMHNAVSKGLKPDVKSKIAGVALFGDTRNQQDKGHIPNFPTEKSKVWCNASDGVCGGGLNVNIGHLSYSGSQISEAARYLANLAKSHSPGSSGGSSSPAAPKMPKQGPKPASPPKAAPPKASAAPPKATEAPAAAETPAEAEAAPEATE